MSIRQEHLDAYDNAMSSFKENMELAKSMSGGGAQTVVEKGLGLVQQIAGGYQQLQQFKALLAKGQNVAKVGQKVVNNTIDKVKGNATNPEATTEATTEASTEIPAEVVRPTSTIANAVNNAGNVAEESSGTMSNLAEDASNIDEMPASESLLSSLEAQGASQAAQDVAQIQPISMSAGDSLAPMRAIMGSRAVGEGTTSQLQQNIADFDPEGDITDLGNLSTTGATRAISSGVGNLTESGEGLSAVGEGLASTVSGTASEAGAGLASTLSSTVSPLAAETGAELGSLAIPGIGEAVGVIAGIASFITSLIPPKEHESQELGADFSNTDEHSGVANAAY